MRNIDERTDAVHKRVRELSKQKIQRQNRVIFAVSLVSCFLLIVWIACVMPGIRNRMIVVEYYGLEEFGSIFYNRNYLYYVLIALFGFLLGVSVTLLSVLLKKRIHEDEMDHSND